MKPQELTVFSLPNGAVAGPSAEAQPLAARRLRGRVYSRAGAAPGADPQGGRARLCLVRRARRKERAAAEAEWLALLRGLAVSGGVIEDDSREAIYSPPRGP